MGDTRIQTHLEQPTPAWSPVIYFNDGQVLKLEGCWPHGKAMAIAEQEAYHLNGVESIGAQRAK